MSRKRTPEQIIAKLREAEVALSQGETTGQVCRRLGVSEQMYYRWRKEYGGDAEWSRWLGSVACEQGADGLYPLITGGSSTLS